MLTTDSRLSISVAHMELSWSNITAEADKNILSHTKLCKLNKHINLYPQLLHLFDLAQDVVENNC